MSQLGRDTVFSATEAAEGMQYLAMAGFNTENVMAAMPGLLELAAAGAADLGRTSDIASNILSAFKISASDMGRVSDVLANTFTSSNTTLETLGETMKYVGPVASAVNMSLEDTAATVGLLGNVGIQSSQAGTAVRAALLRLAAPPKMAADALEDMRAAGVEDLDELIDGKGGAQETLLAMGVSTKDAAGNLRPMLEILEELNVKMAGMGSGEKMEKIKKIFGTTASAAMAELLDKAGRTVDEQGNAIVDSLSRRTTAIRRYMEQINNSQGTGARIAKQMNDTTGGSLRVMRSATEDVAIVTGDLFAPAIRTLARGVVVAANAVSGFMEKFPVLSKVVGLAVGGTIMLAGATMLLGYGYSFVRGGLLLAQAAMLKMTGVEVGAAVSAKGLTVAQRALAASTMLAGMATKGVALAFRVLKFGMIGSGIGAILVGIGLAAGYIIEHWDTVGPFFAKLWDGIVSMAKTAWQYMKIYLWDKNPMMLAPRLIVENWDKITTALRPVFDWLKDKFSWVTDSFNGLQKAWNFFFGDDDKAAQVSGSSKAAVTRMENPKAPLVVQSVRGTLTPPPADDVFGDMPLTPVFNYQSQINPIQAPSLSAGAGGLDFLAGLGEADEMSLTLADPQRRWQNAWAPT